MAECQMVSSLPQGWHGIPVATKSVKGLPAPSVHPPATMRKKWNSPLSSEHIHSKLPSFKPNFKMPRQSTSEIILPKSKAKPIENASKDQPPPQSTPNKDHLNEIAKLKKELSTMKTENSILKVKVRRVDDESDQKSHQLEKLRNELKELEKKNSASSQKSKDSELLTLRQKCLRLEGAIKERDMLLKKANVDCSFKLDESTSLNASSLKEASASADSKTDKLNESKQSARSSLTGRSSLSRLSFSAKSQVAKLTDIIHKLEKENLDLQLQVKEKGEEIRVLKRQLRDNSSKLPALSKKPAPPSDPQKSLKSTPPKEKLPKTSTPVKSKPATKTQPPEGQASKKVEPKVIPKKAEQEQPKKPATARKSLMPLRMGAKPVLNPRSGTTSKVAVDNKKSQTEAVKNEIRPVKRPSPIKVEREEELYAVSPPIAQLNETFTKSSSRRSSATFILSPNGLQDIGSAENSFDEKVEKIRRNMAAKKIQRGWKSFHQKNTSKVDPEAVKAMTFVATSLKHHKMRMEKFKLLNNLKNLPMKPKIAANSAAVVGAIQAATGKLWSS